MKKRKIPLICALAAICLLCLWLLTSGSVCIGRIENQTDDQWSHLHTYMNGDITVNFPIDQAGQPCVFQWESGRGSFHAVITDASGNVVCRTTSEDKGSTVFSADSDLTLRIRAQGHGGVFALTRSGNLSLLSDDPADKFLLLGKGSSHRDSFSRTYDCLKIDGKYVNFFVENTGTGPVVISANGSYKRTIDAGNSGHIRVPISSDILAQSITLQCEPLDDSELSIFWTAAQRDGGIG